MKTLLCVLLVVQALAMENNAAGDDEHELVKRRIVAGDTDSLQAFMIPQECSRVALELCHNVDYINDLRSSIEDNIEGFNISVEWERQDCPYKNSEKKEARTKYCNLLVYIDWDIQTHLLPLMELVAPCINYVDATDEYRSVRTASEMIAAVQGWHRDMVSQHKCCHTLGVDYDPFPCQNVITESDLRTADDRCTPFNLCLWSRILRLMYRYMTIVDLLDSLGTRSSCIRGCVGIPEIDEVAKLWRDMIIVQDDTSSIMSTCTVYG